VSVSVVCTCGATPVRDSFGNALPCMHCYFRSASQRPADRIAALEAELSFDEVNRVLDRAEKAECERDAERAAHERTKARARFWKAGARHLYQLRQSDADGYWRDINHARARVEGYRADKAEAERDALRAELAALAGHMIRNDCGFPPSGTGSALAARVPLWRELVDSVLLAGVPSGPLGEAVERVLDKLAALDEKDTTNEGQ
jgi:hypothetical protein